MGALSSESNWGLINRALFLKLFFQKSIDKQNSLGYYNITLSPFDGGF